MLHSDSHFVIGKDHQICQDFASVSTSPMVVALSDGCSMGGEDFRGKDVDIGARVLVKALISQWPEALQLADYQGCSIDLKESLSDILTNSLNVAGLMGVHKNSLYATLSFAYVEDGIAHIVMVGDGTSFFLKKDGSLVHHRITYVGNAPRYLVYASDEKHTQDYLNCSPIGSVFPLGFYNIESYTNAELNHSMSHPPAEYHEFTMPVGDLKCFGVVSDGISSAVWSSNSPERSNPVPYAPLVMRFLRFSNMNGPFATRRLNKFVKDCHLEGIEFSDDLSLAVIANIQE